MKQNCVSVCVSFRESEGGKDIGRNDSTRTEDCAHAHSGAGLMKTASMFAQTASVGLRMSTLMKY